MHTDSKTGSQIQGLPLFDWRAVVVRKPETRAGQYLLSRFPIPPGHADLAAGLMGLGPGGGPMTEVNTLAAIWPPTSDVAREVGQEAERFTELDDNANQTTPADTPNSNHEPRVRRTRAATP